MRGEDTKGENSCEHGTRGARPSGRVKTGGTAKMTRLGSAEDDRKRVKMLDPLCSIRRSMRSERNDWNNEVSGDEDTWRESGT